MKIKYMIRYSFLYICKYTLLFHLSRFITRNYNRILCYHGGSILDEHKFWPGVFITKEKLERQFSLIKKWGYSVVPLSELKHQMNARCPQKHSLVITADDGFYSFLSTLKPVLEAFSFPATLYLTTYYVKKNFPIFNIMLAYIFFITQKEFLYCSFYSVTIEKMPIKMEYNDAAIAKILELTKYFGDKEKDELLDEIAKALDVDISQHRALRIFNIMTADELQILARNSGVDIQLHTHRHQLPKIKSKIAYEINKNRLIIAEILSNSKNLQKNDFCYPSGIWSTDQFDALNELKIETATTLDEGINTINSNPLALKRILCCDDRPLIDFEARLTGFYFLIPFLKLNQK